MKRFILPICLFAAIILMVVVLALRGKKEEEIPVSEPPTTTTEAETFPDWYTGNLNRLTGIMDLPDEAVDQRPVAVMINNISEAMPQYGIEAADIMFEMPVEWDLTRMMAIYPDYQALPDICSIRSCRYYFPALAAAFDSVYVHWGLDETIADYFYSLDIDRYDLDAEMYLDSLAGRDENRLEQGYAWEHTSFMHGNVLPQFLRDDGVDMQINPDRAGAAFNFTTSEEPIDPSSEACTRVDIFFGNQWAHFDYDPETKTYKKWNNGEPQIDQHTGNQIAFTNVFVLETDIWLRDDGYHKGIDWNGGDWTSGYYISNGYVKRITWSKADEYSMIKVWNEDGSEVEVNKGKSYIALNYFNSTELNSSYMEENGDW